MDVNTVVVSDDSADDISGAPAGEGGRRPKLENSDEGAIFGPELGMSGGCAERVRSRAPNELVSEGVGLPGCCDDGGRGI